MEKKYFIDRDFFCPSGNFFYGDMDWENDIEETICDSIDEGIENIKYEIDECGGYETDDIVIYSIVEGAYDEGYDEWVCPHPSERKSVYKIIVCNEETAKKHSLSANEYYPKK